MTKDELAKIKVWREHAAAGTLTLDEMKEAIALLREGRTAAAPPKKEPAKRKTKAQKEAEAAQAFLTQQLEITS